MDYLGVQSGPTKPLGVKKDSQNQSSKDAQDQSHQQKKNMLFI
jgi:hypothetical protein